MIDLDQHFEQAWAGEPPLPDAGTRLAAGKRRLLRRRMVTTTLGSMGVVALIAGGAALVGEGSPRSTAPDFTTTSPSVSPSTVPPETFPVREDPSSPAVPLWADDHQVYRSAEDVEVLHADDSRPVLDARTGKKVGYELVVESRWRGQTRTEVFDFAAGRYRGGGDEEISYETMLARGDSPLYYDHGPGYFEVFDSPVGVDASGLTAKTGATIESQRAARSGEFSTRRFDAGLPSVGVATIVGRRYFAIAGYTSEGKDVIVAQQAAGRSLEEFLAEVKAGMDDGSIAG